MKHPHEGGRYYRQKDQSLTRAANGDAVKTNERKPAPAADAAKKDSASVSGTAKDKTNG